jgi:hypothetical protein
MEIMQVMLFLVVVIMLFAITATSRETCRLYRWRTVFLCFGAATSLTRCHFSNVSCVVFMLLMVPLVPISVCFFLIE